MKLYLECSMGASGDMLMAALLELLPDKEAFIQRMNSLGIPGVALECVPSVKCGVAGSHVHVRIRGEEETVEDVSYVPGASACENTSCGDVHTHGHSHGHDHDHGHGGHDSHEHDHEHEHRNHEGHAHEHRHFGFSEVCGLIGGLALPEKVREDALAVYRLIGEAEANVHSTAIEQIHFHEVGSMDAVADVVGCCLLMHLLNAESISASPVHVGSGFVRCSHGILPVPAPATAYILKGIPVYGGKIKGELCTPTGAALLRHFVGRFGDMAPMKVAKIGYGMGTKDFEALNCVRAFLGEEDGGGDEIIEISCNLDDMTPEAVGYASERLLEGGALDVFTTPIYMKKNRPAIMLTCLCKPDDREEISRLMLRHTTTLGVRFRALQRNKLSYTFRTAKTPCGDIRIKSASGYGIRKEKPEYEDVKAAADKHNLPFTKVYEQAAAAAEDKG